MEGSTHKPTAVDGPRRTTSLLARRSPLAAPARQLEALAEVDLRDPSGESADFDVSLARAGVGDLRASKLEIFQVNVGKLCNMACRHCHVDAGPDRTDAMMSLETMDAVLRAMEISGAHTVDITGGAPELHPHFRPFVEKARAAGKHVIDRCNLTILMVRKYRDLPQWLADHQVEVVASLPHYRRLNTDAQRGDGTFERSIEALRRLNGVGYGQGDPTRILTLMSNPAGAFLGGCQEALERDFKARLLSDHGVSFDRLFALNNMPIARFLEWLLEKGNLQGYMQKLLDAFNPAAVEGLMCKNTLSVSWDGRVYDCDFNQMLALEAKTNDGQALHVRDFDPQRYAQRRVTTARHCYGCTAGAGSSCAGTTS
ncbi:MAG: arsenosugar biosynthesis radical SAM protein ArsS [Deltaproteobacteria bacterium]|nr:arsenosugar biosynthesis radical SAM protein ArsS [Deltaproteobacteria bacterium]